MNGWIDFKVSLGTIIHLVVLIGTLIAVYWKMRELVFALHTKAMDRISELHSENTGRLASLETKVDAIWNWFTTRVERRGGDVR